MIDPVLAVAETCKQSIKFSSKICLIRLNLKFESHLYQKILYWIFSEDSLLRLCFGFQGTLKAFVEGFGKFSKWFEAVPTFVKLQNRLENLVIPIWIVFLNLSLGNEMFFYLANSRRIFNRVKSFSLVPYPTFLANVSSLKSFRWWCNFLKMNFQIIRYHRCEIIQFK